MRIRLLKDWSFHKAGDTADVFEPVAKDWIQGGIAERAGESRGITVEDAVSKQPEPVERAVVGRKNLQRRPT